MTALLDAVYAIRDTHPLMSAIAVAPDDQDAVDHAAAALRAGQPSLDIGKALLARDVLRQVRDRHDDTQDGPCCEEAATCPGTCDALICPDHDDDFTLCTALDLLVHVGEHEHVCTGQSTCEGEYER